MSTIQIDRLLDTAIKQEASDVHLVVGKVPTLRIRGRLKEIKTKVLEPADTDALMKSLAPEHSQAELHEQGGSDFAYAFQDKARFRVSIFKSKGHISIVLRLIPSKLLTLEQIGLPEIVADLCRRPQGMFLVTGPTGSGKTTTLASMIDFINQTMDRHIVTVEDPIEYYHNHKKCVVNQREIGGDVSTFAEALRRALRQDPDVVMVGEMRDLETIESAVRAAETGHLVFATLHTTGAAGTISRIIDAFPVNQQAQIRVQLSTSLMAVLSQQLLPRADSDQMVAAYEFMVVTPAIGNMIREGKSSNHLDSAIQTGSKFGMQLLDEHLWNLYLREMIKADQMIDKARDTESLIQRVHKAGGMVERVELDQ